MPTVRACHLRPGPGLTPTAAGWRVDSPHVRLQSQTRLPAGWYCVSLSAADSGQSRKRIELTFPTAGRPAAREAFAWTAGLHERFAVHLPTPADGLRLDVWDAAGTLSLAGFRVRRLSGPAAALRSVSAKLRLLTAHRCLGPAAVRGVRLLLRGDWRRFGRKLLGGLADVRTMMPDAPTVTPSPRHPVTPSPRHPVTLAADIKGLGGYDRLAAALLRHLPAAGLDPRGTVRRDLLPAGVPVRAGRPRLVVGPPFRLGHFAPTRHDAVLTMWESDALEPGWVAVLNRAGLVIVPSRWQAEHFRRDGVTAPLAVVPLGFDPDVYFPCGSRPAGCVFGVAAALSAGGVRKNAQLAIDLFREAFPDDDTVRLRVKVTPGSPGLETFDDPRVEVLRALLPEAELADWYRSLTAFVSLSGGEGFGLHLLEALACGVPLVAPRHGGPAEFFDAAVGWPLAFAPVPAVPPYRGSLIAPDPAAVVRTLRAVAADPTRPGAPAERAGRFTWAATAAGVRAAMHAHHLLP